VKLYDKHEKNSFSKFCRIPKLALTFFCFDLKSGKCSVGGEYAKSSNESTPVE
jgi:hypothetical protein